MMNVLNGGAHADNSVDFQEFMVVPVGAPTFASACGWAPRSSTRSRRRCTTSGLATAVGDEGGFAPNLESNEAALQALIEGIEAAGYTPGEDIAIALDPATSEIYADGVYELAHEGRTLVRRRAGRLLGRPRRAATRSSRSRTAWTRRTGTAGRRSPSSIGDTVQLVGDDLFVTNTERLQARHRRRRRATRS